MLVSSESNGPVGAISLDFYQTLAHHREGRGRGAMVMEYLNRAGLDPAPWEHQVLYDIFADHLESYDPRGDSSSQLAYRRTLAERLFQRLAITEGRPEEHADSLWQLLGPSSLRLYPEVIDVLSELERVGVPLVIISNWQRGLRHFCDALGIAGFFKSIHVSAEIGYQKPDPRIFEVACRKLGMSCEDVLHVGDSVVDDVIGAGSAGMPVLHLIREDSSERSGEEAPTIRSLEEILAFVKAA